ncbi:MAG: hypothetical protein Q4E11_04865 [Corynebacterium sp.]|uniref:hypothetical protein n=1 Tax=Corynebacterium sp. TaxID=1720 RepID=UPI0026DB1115|nr:hypothetical protein [Corynebacterium sp.]MDO5029898.1 hypothetical protein [Corynebacterium sp.]
MCRPVECNVCHKTTWAGCGQHIDQVKATVPANQWCDGKHTEAEIKAAGANRGFFGRLFN